MALIYITGMVGTGKSTVSEELNKRGFESHDADEEGFNYWFNRKTHNIAKNLSKYKVHTPSFHKKYEWLMIRSKVEELHKRAQDKIIFLCGVTGNENDMSDLFAREIELIIDENTLKHRLSTRISNDFGKAPFELELVLGWYKSLTPRTLTIDASQSLDKVVDEILKIANS